MRMCAASISAVLIGSLLGSIRLNAELVAYWPLNDGPVGAAVTGAVEVIDAGLTFTDAVPNDKLGSWVNDPVRGIVYRTVQDNRLNAGTQGITTNFTWSLWVKILEDRDGAIMGTRVNQAASAGKWSKLTADGMGNWASLSGLAISTGSPWHHIAVRGTVNPDGLSQKVELFKDGILIDTEDATATVNFDGPLQLGGASSYTEDIGGLMSDVAIWNEAVSDERIQNLASGGHVNQEQGSIHSQKAVVIWQR